MHANQHTPVPEVEAPACFRVLLGFPYRYEPVLAKVVDASVGARNHASLLRPGSVLSLFRVRFWPTWCSAPHDSGGSSSLENGNRPSAGSTG